jgi:hypothetical protein
MQGMAEQSGSGGDFQKSDFRDAAHVQSFFSSTQTDLNSLDRFQPDAHIAAHARTLLHGKGSLLRFLQQPLGEPRGTQHMPKSRKCEKATEEQWAKKNQDSPQT